MRELKRLTLPKHVYDKLKGNEDYSCGCPYHQTQHTGHNTEEDRDVNTLRIDDRQGIGL
jgi:hypothetical protein